MAGAVAFLILGVFLIRRGRSSRQKLVYLSIYAFACVFLFSMSGVYHMAPSGGTFRKVMMRLDHAAIFVLIAGTFTPVHGILFRGRLRWLPLAFIWSIAIASLTIKVIFFDELAQGLSLLSYLGLGWCGVVSGILLARKFGATFIRPLLWGGIAYTVGAFLDTAHWLWIIPGVVHAHELFHITVLIGALLHLRFVWKIADSVPADARSSQAASS